MAELPVSRSVDIEFLRASLRLGVVHRLIEHLYLGVPDDMSL